MIYLARSGTPHHMDEKRYPTAGPAKKHLRDQIGRRMKWAVRFNLALNTRLASIREEIDGIDLVTLKEDEVRHWEADDDYTGVMLVFELEKRSA